MELKNEYLMIIDKNKSSALYKLCFDIKTFNKLLTSESNNIKIERSKISNQKITCNYDIKNGNVKEKTQRYFYLKINFNGEESEIDYFDNLLKQIKNMVEKDGVDIETLRNDLSFHYSQLAYSKIHKIENLMRKFITYFMITNIGKDWIEESSPKMIKDALDKSKRKAYMDKLQQLDFIHLGDLLFKSFQDKDISLLQKLVKNYENDEEKTINYKELKEYIPQSNWDRYFKNKVDCDDKFLKEKWENLYELRNIIAHTSDFKKENYLDIEELVSEVEEKLNKAFDTIDNIEIDSEEKEQLSENIAVNINQNIGKFLSVWKDYEKNLEFIYNNIGNKYYMKSISKFINDNPSLSKEFDDLKKYRNNIVHSIDIGNEEDLTENIKRVEKINTSTWKIQVLEAFKHYKGKASLNEIYQYIENKTGKKLTLSGQSSIRKAIYLHSSDTDIFQGKENLFEKVAAGVWKVR